MSVELVPPAEVDSRHRSVGPAGGRAADSGEEAPGAKLTTREPFHDGESRSAPPWASLVYTAVQKGTFQ
jgi:hypothetical protein